MVEVPTDAVTPKASANGFTGRTAFITGITGQDGSYLAEHLLTLGYRVVGMVRRKADPSLGNVSHLAAHPNVHFVDGDLTDLSSLIRALKEWMPDEIYNLAAQSFVGVSFKEPYHTAIVTGLGVCNLLEAFRTVCPKARFYQASSSEQFGKVWEVPQKETTPPNPRSPYAVAKTFAHFLTINYRDSYNLFALCGILFNHESERRGKEFVTRKITDAVAGIVFGEQACVELGNLEASRDWGYAPDYVRSMHAMLQQATPEDFVICTGETHTVREFAELAFGAAGLDYRDYVRINDAYKRPAEVDLLKGDRTKADRLLQWRPVVSFPEMVHRMVCHDLASRLAHGKAIVRGQLPTDDIATRIFASVASRCAAADSPRAACKEKQ